MPLNINTIKFICPRTRRFLSYSIYVFMLIQKGYSMTKTRSYMMSYMMILCSLLLLVWNTTASAQMTRLNVGYSAISGDALPAWIAKDAGIFEKKGLNVT